MSSTIRIIAYFFVVATIFGISTAVQCTDGTLASVINQCMIDRGSYPNSTVLNTPRFYLTQVTTLKVRPTGLTSMRYLIDLCQCIQPEDITTVCDANFVFTPFRALCETYFPTSVDVVPVLDTEYLIFNEVVRSVPTDPEPCEIYTTGSFSGPNVNPGKCTVSMALKLGLTEANEGLELKMILNDELLPVMTDMDIHDMTDSELDTFTSSYMGSLVNFDSAIAGMFRNDFNYVVSILMGPFNPPGSGGDGTGKCVLLLNQGRIFHGIVCFPSLPSSFLGPKYSWWEMMGHGPSNTTAAIYESFAPGSVTSTITTPTPTPTPPPTPLATPTPLVETPTTPTTSNAPIIMGNSILFIFVFMLL